MCIRDRLRSFEGHTDYVLSLAIRFDGKHLASGSRDTTIIVWHYSTGRRLHKLEGHASSVLCVLYSPSGGRIVSTSEDTTINIWDAVHGTVVQTLSCHQGPVFACAYSPDGRHLLSSSSAERNHILTHYKVRRASSRLSHENDLGQIYS